MISKFSEKKGEYVKANKNLKEKNYIPHVISPQQKVIFLTLSIEKRILFKYDSKSGFCVMLFIRLSTRLKCDKIGLMRGAPQKANLPRGGF